MNAPQRIIRSADQCLVPIGTTMTGKGPVEVTWDSHKAINPHWLIGGESGGGKSHRIRAILPYLSQTMQVHLVDSEGDLIPNCPVASILFSETTPYGLNPLEISADPNYGGPRKKANAFIDLLLRQTTLGDRQQAALFRLIIDMYRRFGFYMEDSRTWSLDHDPRHGAKYPKRHPTLSDLRKSIWDRYSSLKIGIAGTATEKFQDCIKLKRKMNTLQQKSLKGEEGIEVQFAKAKQAFLETMDEALDLVQSGDELKEVLDWDSVEAIKGIHDRIQKLEQSGIFKGQKPTFDPNIRVWRYDISPLTTNEAQFFVHCLQDMLFNEAKARGEVEACDTCLVLDEAKIYATNDDENPMNVTATRGRKFGLMQVLATQDLLAMPPQVIKNSATKLILGVDTAAQTQTEKRLNLEPGRLGKLRAHETALLQAKFKGKSSEQSNTFWEVTLPQ